MTVEREAASAQTANVEPRTAAAPALPGLESALLGLQRSAGNQAVLRLMRQGALGSASPSARNRLRTRVLARRRLPDAATLDTILTDPSPGGPVAAPDAAAHQAGLERLLIHASDELTTAELNQVWAILVQGTTFLQFLALPRREMLMRTVRAVLQVKPTFQLGDPLLIDTGPRPGTADAANLQRLVRNANAIFTDIANGTRDADIRQVFGAANLAAAKAKYRAARVWMNELFRLNRVVTDRSGYNVEAGLGGLTGFQEQISVSPETIDNPDDNESVVTMIHESLHAGNRDVSDFGYIDRPFFTELAESVKLTNAAHFEVVPRRILSATFAFAGQTFVPAGTSSGGVSAPPLTPRQQAIRQASEMIREAWTLGLNLHTQYVRILRNPREWTSLDLSTVFGGVPRGVHFADTLPFWSKVEKLTIHERTNINPASADPSTRPVTRIDVALSESVVRKLSRAGDVLPTDEAAADAFERANATAAERAAATTVTAERDLLILLVARRLNITGNPDRDLRAILRMGTAGSTWRDILTPRSPADFAD